MAATIYVCVVCNQIRNSEGIIKHLQMCPLRYHPLQPVKGC